MMAVKEFLKKEVYTLRLTKKNRIVGVISAYYIMTGFIFAPFVGFFLGLVFTRSNDPMWLDVFIFVLLMFLVLPLFALAIAEKLVFKTIIETKADKAEDIEVAVIVDEMKKSFALYLEKFPYRFVVFKGSKELLERQKELDRELAFSRERRE